MTTHRVYVIGAGSPDPAVTDRALSEARAAFGVEVELRRGSPSMNASTRVRVMLAGGAAFIASRWQDDEGAAPEVLAAYSCGLQITEGPTGSRRP